MRGSVIIFCLLLFCAGETKSACPLTPDDIIPISREKERNMGAAIARQVEKKYGATDDPLLQQRFEKIGRKLAAVCDRQELIYHFKVLKSGEGEKENFYNAFALPGGYVFIFDVMMEMLGTDDKIAAVTAHELGHICARHPIKRLQSALGVNALMVLALATARDGRSVVEANYALMQLMMAYSREEEFEADKLSVKYVRKAGFDVNGVLGSLLALQQIRKEGREHKYAHFKSHPYLSERIAAVRREIKGYTDFDSYINLPKQKDGFY